MAISLKDYSSVAQPFGGPEAPTVKVEVNFSNYKKFVNFLNDDVVVYVWVFISGLQAKTRAVSKFTREITPIVRERVFFTMEV